MRDLAALTAELSEPAVHALLVDAPSKSHFGGSPALPEGSEWPTWNGKRLVFLTRLSLDDLHRAFRIDWLPATGALLFFYEADEQPWGFDPGDRGCCSVIHVPDLEGPIASGTAAPGDEYLPHRSIAFRRIDTRPSWERTSVRDLCLSESESDEYSRLLEAPFSGLPKHQVAGLPSPVQGDDMELECQLASNGLYRGDSSGYYGPKAEALKPGAKDWRLLLQLDTDDDLGVMWGDCGTLYFWVREAEARDGRFSNTWLILQCS